MTNDDYRRKAADAVMRKSMVALEMLQNRQALAPLRTDGSTEPEPAQHFDDALVAETRRAMEMATAALQDIDSIGDRSDG